MTNSERIRQMTDEELLETFFGQEAYLISIPITETKMVNGVQLSRTSTIRLLDWMKLEVED